MYQRWPTANVPHQLGNVPQVPASQLVIPTAGPSNPVLTNGDPVSSQTRRRSRQPAQMMQQQQPQIITHVQPSQTVQHSAPPQAPQELEIPPPVAAAVQPAFGYPIFIAQPRPIHPGQDANAQAWQAQPTMAIPQTHIAPQQTQHMLQRATQQAWEGYDAHTGAAITADPGARAVDATHRNDYYDSLFEDDGTYEQPPQPYIEQQPTQSDDASPSQAVETAERPRGRKRTRSQFNAPAAPASTLVTNRNPPARSPTPPTRIIKSTYGGNLFTADDVMYLKKYIDYCQDQGLVLRHPTIRVSKLSFPRAHHTNDDIRFYSWRRYCNKHQIRLGGYVMNQPRVIASSDQQVTGEEQSIDDTAMSIDLEPAPVDLLVQSQEQPPRRLKNRPQLIRRNPGTARPHRLGRYSEALRARAWRSRTRILISSSASWTTGSASSLARVVDEILAAPQARIKSHGHGCTAARTADKKMRYSREDDILLAKYFAEKPEGTSDKVFQAFGRLHPHHPWKGWQEHHRIHKAKIDHLVKQIHEGVFIDVEMAAALA
ncbi:MYB transcription factor [Salix suchowensis]|nr:MYB transcription factor [Salix suchowensis]